jgi:hypothetical protein
MTGRHLILTLTRTGHVLGGLVVLLIVVIVPV